MAGTFTTYASADERQKRYQTKKQIYNTIMISIRLFQIPFFHLIDMLYSNRTECCYHMDICMYLYGMTVIIIEVVAMKLSTIGY